LNENEILLPPHSEEAETSVLGSCLIDTQAIHLITLQPNDFYFPKHQKIWEAMLSVKDSGRPTDLVVVSDELERTGQSEYAGGLSYLANLSTSVPTSINVEHYASIVLRCSKNRKLISLAGKLAAMGYEDNEHAVEESARLVTALSLDNSVTSLADSSTDWSSSAYPIAAILPANEISFRFLEHRRTIEA